MSVLELTLHDPTSDLPGSRDLVRVGSGRRAEREVRELVEPVVGQVSILEDEPVRSSFARCADGAGTLTHLFFSEDEFDIARAKAICGRCGLAPTCLADALERAEPYGVWGGQLVVDGVIVAVKRGRGRPPKHPRPALVVDEVPVPPHLLTGHAV